MQQAWARGWPQRPANKEEAFVEPRHTTPHPAHNPVQIHRTGRSSNPRTRQPSLSRTAHVRTALTCVPHHEEETTGGFVSLRDLWKTAGEAATRAGASRASDHQAPSHRHRPILLPSSSIPSLTGRDQDGRTSWCGRVAWWIINAVPSRRRPLPPSFSSPNPQAGKGGEEGSRGSRTEPRVGSGRERPRRHQIADLSSSSPRCPPVPN